MTSTAELARAEPGSLTGALRPWSLFACSGLVLMLALLVPAAPIGIIVLGAAAGHFATGGLIWAARLRQSVVRFLTFRRLRKQAAEDAAPVLLTNRAGRLLFANPSAVSLGAAPSGSAASVLRPYIASADSLAERLTVAASLTGDAVEDVATRTHVMRVRVRVAAENLLAWRLEQIDRTAALKVLSGAMPALSLTEDGAVEYANPAAQNQLGDIAKVAGPLPDLPGHRAVSLPGFGGRQDIIYVPQGLGS